jgi:hypothetical protein
MNVDMNINKVGIRDIQLDKIGLKRPAMSASIYDVNVQFSDFLKTKSLETLRE